MSRPLHDIRRPGAAGRYARTVVVLMCCHNRRESTLRALESLRQQEGCDDTGIAVVLVDDGSDDGTRDAVTARFPEVLVVLEDGQRFWSGAMVVAQDVALSHARPDFLLWLNDDVQLSAPALQSLLAQADLLPAGDIIVGALQDAATGALTYSGYRRGPSGRPLDLVQLAPAGSRQPVDTFNGNVVLVSRSAYTGIGGVDDAFRHGVGDVDYGFRAAAAGFSSYLGPGYAGCCSRNSMTGTWRDGSLPMRDRLRQLFSPKGIYPPAHWRLQVRYAGWRAPVLFAATYTRPLGSILRGTSRPG